MSWSLLCPDALVSTTPGLLGCHCLPVSMVTEVLLQVSEKLKLAEKTALDIDRLRDGYRPAARRGAILFFVLSEMALVNSMYQYSLIAFLEVFGLSLKKSLPDSILLKRLKNIMDTLTFNIYNYGCTGEGRGGEGARLGTQRLSWPCAGRSLYEGVSGAPTFKPCL